MHIKHLSYLEWPGRGGGEQTRANEVQMHQGRRRQHSKSKDFFWDEILEHYLKGIVTVQTQPDSEVIHVQWLEMIEKGFKCSFIRQGLLLYQLINTPEVLHLPFTSQEKYPKHFQPIIKQNRSVFLQS